MDVEATQPVNQPGKRYHCTVCGTEVICARRGSGNFTCHGEPMALVKPDALPATD
jgi:hypothetical protein